MAQGQSFLFALHPVQCRGVCVGRTYVFAVSLTSVCGGIAPGEGVGGVTFLLPLCVAGQMR